MNFSKWNLPNLKKTDLNTKAGRKLAYTCLKIFLLLLLVGAVLGTAAGFGALKGLIATAPDISNLSVTPSESATYIYNSDGSVMQKLSLGSSNRTIVTIDQIPEDLQHAVVAIEDERSTSTRALTSAAFSAPAFTVLLPAASTREPAPSPSSF